MLLLPTYRAHTHLYLSSLGFLAWLCCIIPAHSAQAAVIEWVWAGESAYMATAQALRCGHRDQGLCHPTWILCYPELVPALDDLPSRSRVEGQAVSQVCHVPILENVCVPSCDCNCPTITSTRYPVVSTSSLTIIDLMGMLPISFRGAKSAVHGAPSSLSHE